MPSLESYWEAEDVVLLADRAHSQGDEAEARALYTTAAQMYERLREQVLPERPFTWQIVTQSTAALYYRAGNHERATQIAQQALASGRVTDGHVRMRLQQIVDAITGGDDR